MAELRMFVSPPMGPYIFQYLQLCCAARLIILLFVVVRLSVQRSSCLFQLSTLGTVSQVGQKLSKGRDMELVSARDRVTEGIRLYVSAQCCNFGPSFFWGWKNLKRMLARVILVCIRSGGPVFQDS